MIIIMLTSGSLSVGSSFTYSPDMVTTAQNCLPRDLRAKRGGPRTREVIDEYSIATTIAISISSSRSSSSSSSALWLLVVVVVFYHYN